MSLTSAMLVGFTGIKSNSVTVDTVGDNLANVNTTAFKSQRTLFETLMYRTLREGEAPSASSGGSLPYQVGAGSTVAAVQRSFDQGSFESTSFPSDLAIDGRGFFVLDAGDGAASYTRDGSFGLDAQQTFVAKNGAVVQVFPADAEGTIQVGTLSSLRIPLGSSGPAVSTSAVAMDGTLSPTTGTAANSAVVASAALMTDSGATATGATALTDLVNSAGVPLFSQGDELVISATKGGLAAANSPFIVGTTGSSLGDLASHMQNVFGMDPSEPGDPPAGVSISDGSISPAGSIVVRSNRGEVNALSLDASSVRNATGTIGSPFNFSQLEQARGGGDLTTSFQVFDSLGNPVDVRVRMTMESKSESGSTWRFLAESEGDSDAATLVGAGTVSFDATGRFLAANGSNITIDRAAVGSETPLVFDLDFSGTVGLPGADGESVLRMRTQNGSPAGVMIGYAIDSDGVIEASFSNQLTQTLGQVALATFTNEEALIARGDNQFVPGVNSGDAQIVAPRSASAGGIAAGQLEQSNVEIAREFLNLISASSGISSASRVVRVADELLQELLLLAR